jgi:hypothetical protein
MIFVMVSIVYFVHYHQDDMHEAEETGQGDVDVEVWVLAEGHCPAEGEED